MKRLRCAVTGLGRIGSLLEDDRLREKPATHAGAIAQNPDCTLVAGCDIREDRRARFEKRWDCKNTYQDTGRMLSRTSPDILHIATPPDTHLEIVRTAVLYGVRMIVCEKPLAEKEEDARHITDLHKGRRTKILVNHERRYSADYRMARERIQKRAYGELLSIHAMLYMGRHREANDILLDDGTHLIDIINFLTGSALDLVQKERFDLSRQQTLLVMGRVCDTPVVFEVASGRTYVTFELDLIFSHGRIRIGNGTYEEHESGPSPYYEGMNSLLRKKTPLLFPTGYFSNMMEDAVLCAREEKREPVSSAPDGYKALAFITRVKD
jgi:predicted dehydrogenase